VRRFNDLVGLGYEGYWAVLALAVLAWYENCGRRGDVRRILGGIISGPNGFRRRVVSRTVGFFYGLGYLEFMCVTRWRPGGWRSCPKDWRIAQKGYEWLGGKLANLGVTLEDVLSQPDPLGVKNLIDGKIKQLYREHWAHVRHYEEVAGSV
jgi:hypothetical protein